MNSGLCFFFLVFGLSQIADGAKLFTYNTGLRYSGNSYPIDRFSPSLRAVVHLAEDKQIDLMCLQEIWVLSEMNSFASALSPVFQYIETGPAAESEPCWCTIEEITPFLECYASQCAALPESEVNDCTTECYLAKASLNTSCISCLSTQIDKVFTGQSTVEESLVKCFSQVPGDPNKCFAYGGTNGKILASRTPLNNVDHLIFNTTTIKRSAIYAKVHLPTLGDTHVVCTHLTTTDSTVPYSGMHGSNRAENKEQTVAVLDWLQSKVKNPKEPVIIMGDLNSSPSLDHVVPAVKGIAEDTYQLWTDAGFSNPYASSSHAQCTLCSTNPLVVQTVENKDCMLDHILTRGIRRQINSQALTLFENSAVMVDTETFQVVPYSDHYGVFIEVNGCN